MHNKIKFLYGIENIYGAKRIFCWVRRKRLQNRFFLILETDGTIGKSFQLKLELPSDEWKNDLCSVVIFQPIEFNNSKIYVVPDPIAKPESNLTNDALSIAPMLIIEKNL